MILRSSNRSLSLAALFAAIAAAPSRAQCLEWDARFYTSGMDAVVHTMTTFDDGSGAALFVGGFFESAGPFAAQHVVKRVGANWVATGAGIAPRVRTLQVLDLGSGPTLHAGTASNVQRWNGTSWQLVASLGDDIRAVAAFDDGSGTALYAGGDFALPDPQFINRIAKWTGLTWLRLDDGLEGTSQPAVHALAVFDDGSGTALYAGGQFNLAGGATATHIARWNGTSWSPVGSGMNSPVFALLVHDDGSGPALYAGGNFTVAGGVSAPRVARWNGTSWSALSGGTNNSVLALSMIDDGSGPALFASGDFTLAGGSSANRIAKWNGSSWASVGGGLDDDVNAIAGYDDGSGSTLWAGGLFFHADGAPATRLARWNGTSWSAESEGQGIEGDFVQTLAQGDIGAGPRLFAGGEFTIAGSTNATRIAQWDGSSWSALGSGVSPWYPMALLVHDDGSGPALYAGGPFTTPASCIARWNGTSWSAVGTGVTGGAALQVSALATFDDGSGIALYAGGGFTTAGGGAASNIARWNGSSWSPVGTGIGGGTFTSGTILALEVFDDGSGPALFAGGDFESAGGSPASRVAKWNGTSWSALGSGTSDLLYDFEVYNAGTGPELYACGEFTSAGGGPAAFVAKWNGTSWSALGSGVNASIKKLNTFDYGAGTALFAGGGFTIAGGVPAERIASWNGTSWSAVNGGVPSVPGSVDAMTVFDDGLDSAPDLYIGGQFAFASTTPSRSIAELHGCPAYVTYCFGDGLDPVVTAQCPCSNFGDPGHGCANSNAALGGAHLTATGTVSPNTLLFTCDGIPNNALATFWRGTTNTAGGGVVHDGIQCLGGTTIRFGSQNAGQLGNPPNTVSTGTIGLAPGSTRYYQLLYRNPAPGFCPPGTYNFSNGIVVTW